MANLLQDGIQRRLTPLLRHLPLALVVLLLAACTATAGPTPTPTPAPRVSFARDVLPIFQARCIRCHSGPQAPFQLQLISYDAVMKGSVQYKVIKPGDPAGSYLYQYVESEFMPLGGPPLTKEQKETIREWIEAGAPDN